MNAIIETVSAKLDFHLMTIDERAAYWAQSINQERETCKAMLSSCETFPEVKALLLKTLQGIPEQADRVTLRKRVDKAIERAREDAGNAVLAWRADSSKFPNCTSEMDVVEHVMPFQWLDHDGTVSWSIAKIANLKIEAAKNKAGTCIPPVVDESATVADATPAPAAPAPAAPAPAAPAESATVADATPAPAKPAPVVDEWDGLPRERVIKRAVQYRKQAHELQGVVARQGETIKAKDDQIRDLLARIAELEAKPKRTRKTGTTDK